MFDLRKRLYFLIPTVLAALLHNVIHESTHYVAARLLGEGVQEFRFLTNGFLTSQVVYAAPVAERSGAHWLVIAWAPAVVTTLIGYALFLTRRRWLGGSWILNAGLWFATAFFLLIDPFYFAVLSHFIGSDVDAVAAVGWLHWPVQAVAGVVFVLNVLLFIKLRRESNAQPERYLP